ncbi:hypothetical protein IID10_03505 [candidate division KSB1 bacterium]|nr:hypothetical protein [candidate division KSB1 bacterium]
MSQIRRLPKPEYFQKRLPLIITVFVQLFILELNGFPQEIDEQVSKFYKKGFRRKACLKRLNI